MDNVVYLPIRRDAAVLEPYPPMALGPAAKAGLLGLRVALGLITAMALFTFLHGAPVG